MEQLQVLSQEAQQAIEKSDSVKGLDEVRVKYLGKKGELTVLLKGLSKLSPEERPKVGAEINAVKEQLLGLIQTKKIALELSAMNAKLANETIDVTLPGRGHV